MRTLELVLRSTAFASAMLLAGCGESVLSSASDAPRAPSFDKLRMTPDKLRMTQEGAPSGDLMYVADTKDNRVDVYTYPAGKRAGSLTGFEGLAFLCTDPAGNVFIPNYGLSEILEYAHGGTKPIATLRDSRAMPYSCAIDPKSGDLAVVNYMLKDYKGGNIVIYRHAKGSPKTYMVYGISNEYFCTYDDAGDLFVEGGNPAGGGSGSFGLEELKKGARLFEQIVLQNTPAYPNGLQWVDDYLAVGTGTIRGPSSGDTYVYHMQISDFVAKTIGTTELDESGPTANFFIDGSTILVSGGELQSNVGFFPYPGGGAPTKTPAETSAYGVVVSAAARLRAQR